jgi:hypothetical protein
LYVIGAAIKDPGNIHRRGAEYAKDNPSLLRSNEQFCFCGLSQPQKEIESNLSVLSVSAVKKVSCPTAEAQRTQREKI